MCMKMLFLLSTWGQFNYHYFWRFLPFSAKKWRFSQTQCYDYFLLNYLCWIWQLVIKSKPTQYSKTFIPNKWADPNIKLEPIQSEWNRGYQTETLKHKRNWRENKTELIFFIHTRVQIGGNVLALGIVLQNLATARLARFFFHDKKYQKRGKYTKSPLNNQMTIKCTKWPYYYSKRIIYQPFPRQGSPKFIPIWEFWFDNLPFGNPGAQKSSWNVFSFRGTANTSFAVADN
jgi:hypothetical protein